MPFIDIPAAPIQEVYLTASVASYHLNRNKGLNETNPGLGFTLTDGVLSRSVGAYKNSFNRTSVYAVAGYMPIKIGNHFRFGIVGGLVTGYSDKPVLPVANVAMNIDYGDYGASIFFVPPYEMRGYKAGGVFGLHIRYKLK